MKRSLKNLLFIIFVFSLHPFSKPYFDAEASICFSNNNACYIVSNEPFQECQDNDYSNNNSSDNDPYGLDVFDRDSEPMSIDDRPDPEPRQINNTNKTKPKLILTERILERSISKLTTEQIYNGYVKVRGLSDGDIKDSWNLIKKHELYKHRSFRQFLQKYYSHSYSQHVFQLERECKANKKAYKKVLWPIGQTDFRYFILEIEAPRLRRESLNAAEKVEQAKEKSKNWHKTFIEKEKLTFKKNSHTNSEKFKYRAEAILLTSENPKITPKEYTLSNAAISDLNNAQINSKKYQNYSGNLSQHLLISELVGTINETANLKQFYGFDSAVSNVCSFIYRSTNIAHKFGEENQLEKGFAISDFCIAVLKVGTHYSVLLAKSVEYYPSGCKNSTLSECPASDYLLTFVHNEETENLLLQDSTIKPENLNNYPRIKHKNLTLNYLDALSKASTDLSKVIILSCINLHDFKKQILPLDESCESRWEHKYKQDVTKNVLFTAKIIVGDDDDFLNEISQIIASEIKNTTGIGSINVQKALMPIKEIISEASKIVKDKADEIENERKLEKERLEQERQEYKEILEKRKKFKEELENTEEKVDENFSQLQEDYENSKEISQVENCALDSKQFKNQQNDSETLELANLEKAFSKAATRNLQNGDANAYKWHNKHKQAINQTLLNPNNIETKKYVLNDHSKIFLGDLEIATENFANLDGNPAQHQLHADLVETVNNTSKLNNTYFDNFHMVGISKIIYRSADLARVNNVNKQYGYAHLFSQFASALLKLGLLNMYLVDNVIDISYETLCQAGDIAIRGLIIANDAIIISSDAITKTGKIVGRGLVKGGAKIIDGVKDYGNKIIDQPLAVLVDAGILTLSVFFPITCLVTAGSLAGLNVAFNFKEFTNKAGTFWKDNFTNESWENIAENSIATAVALFASGIAYGKIGGGIKEATALSKQLMYVIRNEAKVAAAFSGISKQSQKFLTPITTIFRSNAKVLQAASETGVSPFIAATEFIKDNPEILRGTKSVSKTIQKVAKTRNGLEQTKTLGKGNSGKIKTFIRKFKKKRNKKLETGARRVKPLDEINAEEIWAPKEYQRIRANKTDVREIAKNTGLSEYKIKRIKDHLFYDKHVLRERICRFDPDAEIASAWDRLIKGDFVKNDLDLLKHEYFESKFERIFKTNYDTAHNKTWLKRKWFPPSN